MLCIGIDVCGETTVMNLIQARKMEAIGNMAGGVAHDFNKPGSIIGAVELLSLHARRQRKRCYFECCDRATSLIGQ